MSNLKKMLYVGATASLILWSVGSALPVSAVAISDGDLVKTAASSAVYYIQGSQKRVFPHANVYYSWYTDFSTVKEVSASDLAAYSDGNAMPFRDGALFRGVGTGLHGYEAIAVYYIQDAKLRPVKSSEIYQALFKDADWAKVTWVPDDLLTKFTYPLGTMIESSASHPDGSLVKYEGTTQKYLISGGKKRAISDAAFAANRYQAEDVITISASEVYADGDAIAGSESALVTPGWVSAGVAGALSVSLSADNPAAATLAKGASNVNLLKVRLVAGASAVEITGLKFKRTGVGATSDWSDLYLYEDNTRITSIGRTLNTDHEVEFPALSISVAANSSKVLTLRGDILCTGSACATTSATVGAEHIFGLTEITTSATATGLPVTGNKFVIGSQAVGTATISRSSLPANPAVGAKEAEVLAFKIQNTSTNQDITFDQVVFTFAGTLARANLTNLKLFLAGETSALATAAAINSNDTITLTLSAPYTILKGLTKTFLIKADIGGKVGENLSLYIDQTNHLVVTDKQYSTGAKVSIDASIDAAGDTQLTLKGGTITLADNGPAAGKVGKNQNDVILTKFSVTAQRNVEVRRLTVTLGPASTVNNEDNDISDLRIKDLDTGATLASATVLLTAVWDSAYTLTNTFNLTAGVTRNLAITVDLGADTDGDFNNQYISATLGQVTYGTTQVYIYDTGTGQYLEATDVVPNSITGDNQQIIASDISFSLASTPVSGTFVKGATNVESIGVVFTASDASNLSIRQIKFRAYANQVVAGTYTTSVDPATVVSQFKLYDGSTLLSTKTVSGWTQTLDYGFITFDGLNIAVNKGTNKKLVVKADISGSLTAASWYYLALEGSDEHTIAYDADGNILTIAVTDDVNLTPSVEMAITVGGTMTMALDGDTPVAGLAVAGTSNVSITKVKFTANSENFTINKLTIANASSTYDRAVTAVKLTYPGGSASGYLASGTVNFTGLNWLVEKDTSEVVIISADLNTIVGGATSGDQIKLNITCATAANCEAVGASSKVLGDADSELSNITTGNITYLRKTVPTVTLASNSASGTFVPGNTELGTFTVTADAAADIELANIQWTLETNGANWKADLATTDFEVYDTANLSDNILDNTGVSETYSTSTGVFEIIWADSVRPVVAKGASKSYLLKVDTLSSDGGNSRAIDSGLGTGVDAVVRAYIATDAVDTAAAAADFVWDDEVNSTYATINAFGVRNINPLYGNSRQYDR